MATVGEAFVKIVPDTSQFGKEAAKGVGDGLKQTEKPVKETTEKISSEFAKVGKAIATAFVTKQIVNFARDSIAAAEAASTSRARIEQIAKSMKLFGENTAEVTDRLVEYADQIARQTGVDQNSIKLTQAKLLTFRNLARTADELGGAFDRATMAAVDMAAAGFGEASQNAVQLGKALQDPIKGITALSRSGITFTAEQKNLIRSLVETNQVGEAQTLILNAIEEQVGGTAEATANASDKMSVAMTQLKEEVGAALLPAFTSFTEVVIKLVDGFKMIPAPIQNVLVQMGLMMGLTTLLKKNLANLGVQSATLNTALKGLRFAFAGLILAEGIGQMLNQISDASGNLDRKLQALVIALGDTKKAAGASKAPLEAFRDLVAAEGKKFNLANIIKDVGKEITLAGGSIGRDIEYIDQAFDKLMGTSKELAQGLLDDWRIQIESLDKTSAQYQDNIMLIERYQSRLDLANGATEAMAGATGDFAGAQGDAADATGDLNDELEEQANRMQAAMDAAIASFSTEIQVAQAKRKTNDAIAEYNELAESMANGTYRGEDAFLDLAVASEEVSGAVLDQAAKIAQLAYEQAIAAGAAEDSIDKNALFKSALEQLAGTLAPGSPLRKELDAYIRTLGNIERNVVTYVNTVFTQTGQQYNVSPYGASLVRNSATTTTGRTTTTTVVRDPRERANGGIITRPEIALIGEAGPEVVIPLTRPQRAMELMRDSGLSSFSNRTGATVNIEQAIFQNGTDANLVAQKVNAAERARSFST